MKFSKMFIQKVVIYIALLQSLAATLGSLYYSELRHFIPCILCWYQRILMYPLVIIIATGILYKDKHLYRYVLPLSVTGSFVAFYHVLLQNNLLPESVAPCVIGASCNTKYVGYFGFITIPVMSLAAFLVITLCMVMMKRNLKK